MRAGDVTPELDKGTVLCALGLTKSSQRAGIEDFVMIECRSCAMLAKVAIEGKSPGDPLFSSSASKFRCQFASLVSQLGLPTSLRPYSLRRGGATHLFRSCNSFSKVASHGRWGSIKTARIYIQDAIAFAAAVHRSDRTSRKVAQGVGLYNKFL